MRLKNAPFVEIAFGCYFLIDALSPRGMPFWQLIYGTLLLFAAFTVFLGLLKNPLLEKNAIPAISLWAVAIASGVLVPIINGARLFESYFFARRAIPSGGCIIKTHERYRNCYHLAIFLCEMVAMWPLPATPMCSECGKCECRFRNTF